MANWRRLPGVLYANRYRAFTLISLIFALFYGISQLGIVCSNHEVETVLEQLCQKYASGLVIGNLCEPLCGNSRVMSVSCTSSHSGKDMVFSAVWGEEKMHFKSAFSPGKRNMSEIPLTMDEAAFRNAVIDLIAIKLNISITGHQLERLIHLSPKGVVEQNRPLERQLVYNFLESQEYLLSVLFSDRDVFPQVYGTCGHLYGVETLATPNIGSYYIWSLVWLNRVKIAVMIMDMLEQLETDFPDPLHLCDVKFTHFGVSSHGRLKYIDLDQTYPDNILQTITANNQPCKVDTDCDLFDCKAPCNPSTKRCDIGVTNSNLQIICEKIFLGWTLSGKLMVPGLLMTVKTPPQLASLLRQCAENGRSSVPEDIRQRLYTTLTEMEQVLVEKNEN